MSRHSKTDLYMADREMGLTYREIAEKYGISYQSVHTCCARVGETPTKVISEKGCIYPNLRKWLNEDKGRADQFFQAMKGCCVREYLKGTMQPKKEAIDKMLAITGMTYEEMFKEEE